jgi:hypothetical protein
MGLMVLGFPLVGLVVVGGSLALTLAGARRAIDRAVRMTAGLGLGLGAILVILAWAKSGRQEPDTYLTSLPTVAVLDAGQGARLAGHDLRYERTLSPARRPWPDDVVELRCVIIGVVGASPIMERAGLEADLEKEYETSCPRVRLLVDPRGDLAFVVSDDVRRAETLPRLSFRTVDASAIEISTSKIADRLAPPRGWRIGGAGAVACGGFLMLCFARLRRRAWSVIGREGYHRGGGLVELSSSELLVTVGVPAASGLPVGPVVISGKGVPATAYPRDRPTLSFHHARVGTLASLRMELSDRATSMSALALSALVLGLMPLLISRLYGI